MAKLNSINQGQLEFAYQPVMDKVSALSILKRAVARVFFRKERAIPVETWRTEREEAINERIRTSERVEIVEQFNTSVDASAGINHKDSGLGVGAQFSNKNLASRRITFSGHRKNSA